MRTPIAAGVLLLALAAAEPAAAATISAYPPPGTRTAMPGTQISFRGAPPAQLGTISVSGSRSGRHAGTLKAHSDGQGASWVPAKPFRAGERLTVRTSLDINGAKDGDFGLTIGEPTTLGPRVGERPVVGRGNVQHYATEPKWEPPAVVINTVKPGRAPGLVFIAPKAGRGQDGPMIIDDSGRLVWFRPISQGDLAADFRVQTYQGRPALTWWEGKLFTGDGAGTGVIYDSSYRKIAGVHAGNGYAFDLHEFTITPRDTALITVYQRFKKNLRNWGGTGQGRIVDSIVQEIDVKTGLVLFEWHSLGDVGLSESYIVPPSKRGFEWDYMHVNSVAEDAEGNFIVSGRNTWTVYKIGRASGHVVWRLGGKKSDYKIGPGVAFAWQHSARPQPDGTLTIFDNDAGTKPVRKSSRALTLTLDGASKTASLKTARIHPGGLSAATQGDVEVLPNGNQFVGWGSRGYFSEFTPTGEMVFDGRLARGNDTYRAFRYPWSGTPAAPPKVVAETKGGQTTVRASWNGATGVARWQALGGPAATGLAVVGTAPAAGFETAITLPAQGFVAMRALDAAGNVLASSATVKAG
ncbi:arylsulfotransferase family protein [Candidatus Solirubrobacter pratensis]|uniref:arylsulfotransferase family protein n=1 Tax=Candidatus Solirubrobacter pratensis TaxID=1298857 RepID=UPI00041C9D0A|nr:arylsulfotransferase family protein [Candidatus Solirubrobacter pratensis]